MCKSFPIRSSFWWHEGVTESSWGLTLKRHQQRLLVTVWTWVQRKLQDRGVMEMWKLSIMWGWKRPLVEVQPWLQWKSWDIESDRIVGCLLRAVAGVEWSQPGPMRQATGIGRAQPERWGCLSPLETTRSEGRPDAGHWDFNTVRFWFRFALTVTVPWFSLLELKKKASNLLGIL